MKKQFSQYKLNSDGKRFALVGCGRQGQWDAAVFLGGFNDRFTKEESVPDNAVRGPEGFSVSFLAEDRRPDMCTTWDAGAWMA